MRKQVKTLVRYNKSSELLDVYPIFNDDDYIIKNNYVILGSKEEIKKYLNGELEEWELSDAPFGLSEDEYFKIYDGIFEE